MENSICLQLEDGVSLSLCDIPKVVPVAPDYGSCIAGSLGWVYDPKSPNEYRFAWWVQYHEAHAP